MWTLLNIDDEVFVEHGLHFVNGLEPGLAAIDAEVLVCSLKMPSNEVRIFA